MHVLPDACESAEYVMILVAHPTPAFQVIHFSALLSAMGEMNVTLALQVNIEGFHNIIDLSKIHE